MARPPLVELTLARLKMFFREPSAVFWTFGFPVILTVALGIAFRNRPPEPVDVGAYGDGAAGLCAATTKSGELRCRILADEPSARRALRTGRLAVAVSSSGERRDYLYDPTRPESRLARALLDDALQRAAGRQDLLAPVERPVTEPGSRYVDFLVPGLIGMNVLSSGMWGIGYLIVELRTRKIIKRLVATPMRRSHFLISFVIMRMLFLFLELPVLLGFARLAFGVTMHGSLLLFVGLTLLGALAFAGLGLLAASRAENTQTVSGLINLIMLPMFICSGVFFSTARFPDAMQPVMRALPLTALNDALRAVQNEGAGPSQVAMPALVIAIWTIASFALALRLFKWR